MSEVLVILDSNVLHDDPTWQRPSAGRLLALARRDLVSVAVPKIVLLELERQRIATIANKLEQLRVTPRKMEAALAALGVTAAEAGTEIPGDPTITSSELLARYRRQLENLLSTNKVEVLPIPEVTHDAMLDRDLSGRKPFEVSGRGYRDALIWESVLARYHEASSAGAVYFVTNDKNFGEDGLDPQLRAELREAGATFSRIMALDALLEEEVLQEPKLLLQEMIESIGPSGFEKIAEGAVEEYVERLDGISISDDIRERLGVPEEIENIEVAWATTSGNFSWSPYDEFDDTTLLGEGSVNVEVTLQGRVEKENAAVLANSDLHVEGWEDDFATVLLERNARASFDLRIEVLRKSVEDITFLGFDVG
ncbi:MAG: PIN domain-containing protein [Nitrosospira sp.]